MSKPINVEKKLHLELNCTLPVERGEGGKGKKGCGEGSTFVMSELINVKDVLKITCETREKEKNVYIVGDEKYRD